MIGGEEQSDNGRVRFGRTALIVGLSLVLLYFDSQLPLGIASAVLYIGVIWAASTTGGPGHTLGFAVWSTILVFVGYALSEHHAPTGQAIVNRVLSLTAIWSVAALICSSQKHERSLKRHLAYQQFHAKVRNALDMASSEAESLEIAKRALSSTLESRFAEVLVADNSRSQLRRKLATIDEQGGCPVTNPADCPALRRASRLDFPSTAAVDVCSRLTNRSVPCGSAVCVPVNIGNAALGVIHATSKTENDFPLAVKDSLQVLAHSLGARLGLLRTLKATQLKAETDPLTGLLNRRSFSDQVQARIEESGGTHALALCDLDHFKKLNDTAGHSAGDRALKLFSETLRTSLRPTDIVGRYGGEEFVVFLHNCDIQGAYASLERLRENLKGVVATYGGPKFTVSIGLGAYPEDATNLCELIRTADRFLYIAKERGRDQIIASSEVHDDFDPFASATTVRLTTTAEERATQRKHERTNIQIPLLVTTVDQHSASEAVTVNLSDGGVLLRTDTSGFPGDSVELKWPDGAPSLPSCGHILRSVRCANTTEDILYEMAIQFDEEPPQEEFLV